LDQGARFLSSKIFDGKKSGGGSTTDAHIKRAWRRCSALDREGWTIWIADAHRDNGKRFVVRADEKPNAFLGLQSAIQGGDASYAPHTDTSFRVESFKANPFNSRP